MNKCRILKRILCIVIVAIMTVTIIYNDYEEAEATGVEEVLLIEALLSFVASMALEQSGIVADISQFVAECVEDTETLSDAEYVNWLVQQHNSGNASEEIEQIYSAYVDYTEDFYLDIIRDMNKTGAVDEKSALAYITNLFENDTVTVNEVKSAFQNYCTTSEICKSAGDAASFAVNAGCIGLTNKLVNIIGDEFSAAVDVYMEKQNKISSDPFKEFEDGSIIFNVSNSCNLPDNESEFINYISSLNCPYVVMRITNSVGNVSYAVYYSKNAIRISCDSSSEDSIRFTFSNDGITTSKFAFKTYNADGSLDISYDYTETSVTCYLKKGDYEILFWNDLNKVSSSVLDLLNITNLPESHLYSSDYAPATSSDIPIDNLYEGVDVPSQSIDDTAADDEVIYYIDSSITDLADEVAALKVAIDNLDIDGKTYEEVSAEIDKALVNVQEKAESKVESDVKNNINNSMTINELSAPGLIDKFPFCIPFDLISLISVFDAEPEAPYIDIPVVVPVIGVSDHIVFDFEKYEYVVEIMRNLEVVGFILFLLLKTRDLIKG